MPPKRKRTGLDTQSATSTSISKRSTTRGARCETNSIRNAPASKSKLKASTKSAAETPRRKSQNLTVRKKLDNPVELTFEPEEHEPPHKRGNKNLSVSAAASSKRTSIEKWLPYSRPSMEKLFATFADEEDSSAMGAEALERLYQEAKIPMDGAQPLLLAWLLEASDLGRLRKDEWFRGLGALQIDTLEKLSFALSEYEALLISDVPCPKPRPTKKKNEMGPYNKELNYWTYAADTSKAFLSFYMFLFLLAKAPQERNLDVDIAKAIWIALLSEKYPIANDLVEFINDKGSVKGVNKDLWGMTLEFCKTFNASLDGFELDGAWPTLLDDFYIWKKAKQLSGNVVRDEIDA